MKAVYHSMQKIVQSLTRLLHSGAMLFGAALLCAVGAQGASGSATVSDPSDMVDPSGDIRKISAHVQGDFLFLSMTVQGLAGPEIDPAPPVGIVNRYYYHWLLDTDNNPATGRSNAEYENNPTGVTKPIGYERVIMVGWRDGKPNGVEIYDPANEDTAIATGFTYVASGNTITAIVPLATLGLAKGQTVAISAFQEGASNGWQVDWIESATLALSGPSMNAGVVTDPADLPDTSGDIRSLGGYLMGENAVLWMTVENVAAPSVAQTPLEKVNRYYYHWIIDTDNNPATGRSNAEYENNPTGVTKPIGYERVVMVGWRDGKPNGVEVYDPANEDTAILSGFPYQVGGNTLIAIVPVSALGLAKGQTVGLSAFQEGASDGWQVDWVESAQWTLSGPVVTAAGVGDPQDLPDSSGDIRGISAYVVGENLHLNMTVEAIAAPSVLNTPLEKVNRYYYHWIIDTDNNPATGRSNAEYENNPTGVSKPIGYERVVMIGWRDGKPNGLEVYDPLNDQVTILDHFPFQASGNTLSAVIPLTDLGVVAGQTVGFSAFQEGASDGWMVDWLESAPLELKPVGSAQAPIASVDDPDDIGDNNGDIKRIEATVEGTNIVLRMSVYGIPLPTVAQTGEGNVNRYYYHWLIDMDNNPATGRSNAEYENNPTGLTKPIGSERVVMIGWRDGAPNGLEVYDPANENVAIISNFAYTVTGDTIEVKLPLSGMGLAMGQTVAISGFQEGASNGWQVDWVESATLTLSTGELPGISLETFFVGDGYGYEIQVIDSDTLQADSSTVQVWLDGSAVTPQTSKAAKVTTIKGKHASLLEPGSIHTIRLSVKVGTEVQTRDYVFEVPAYTVLPAAGRLSSVDTTKRGFLGHFTQISAAQSGVTSVHSNLAARAEMQLAGELKLEGTETPYYNEADPAGTTDRFVVPHTTVEGVINWFEHAGVLESSINFPQDEAFPALLQPLEGVVVELLTYLELSAGNHKLGVFTEGGHKVTGSLSATGPLVSVFDNEGDVSRVPTYFGRNQFFDVVALEAGYYPIRVLWFQSKRRQEQGLHLEFFSVKDRALHLVNATDDPLAIKAYRAGWLANPDTQPPSLQVARGNGNIIVTYSGRLESATTVPGTWSVAGQESESPKTIQLDGAARFFRAVRD